MKRLGTYLSHGFRALARSPSFLAVSVIVLGISLGNQIAISSLADALLVSAPTAHRPEELVFVGTTVTNGVISHPDLLDLERRSTAYAGTFGYAQYRTAGLVAGDRFANTSAMAVTGNFFSTLGVRPGAGRLFTPEDDRPTADPVAVLTVAMAQQLNVGVGDLIKVNNAPFTVIGLLPADYRPIERGRTDGVWLPISKLTPFRLPEFLTNRGFQWVRFGGRLKPGVTLEAANAELKTLATILKQENPTINAGMGLFAQRYTASRLAAGGSARTIVLLYGISWLLSGLAFINFAALTVLRLLSRRRELVIRTSIGATRGDLIWPLLVELGTVCVLGIAGGVAFASVLFSLFKLDPAMAPIIGSVGSGITLGALGSVVGAVALCGLLVWAVALRSTRQANLSTAAREGASAPQRQWISLGLYAAQFAIVFCLVFVAVTIVRELRQIEQRALPFRTANVLLVEVNTSTLGLAANRAGKEQFFARTLQALREVPGVIAVGGHSSTPLSTTGSTNLILNGEDPALAPDQNFSHYGPTTPGYFEAIGARVSEGRAFTDADITANTRLTVINRAAARRFWPEGAVGKQFKPWPGNMVLTIVGVVEDIPRSNAVTAKPEIFLPHRLISSTNALTFALHVRDDGPAMRNAIQTALKSIWPDSSVPQVYAMADQVERARVDIKLAVRMALVIAGISSIVVGFGLYFFSAYAAAQAVRDSAIRMAIGATPGHVLGHHLWRYRWALLVGTLLGAGLARATFSLSDLVVIGEAGAGLQSGVLTFVCVTVIALIGLCLPLRSLYRVQVYRVLTRAD